jgi:hypothetical protein
MIKITSKGIPELQAWLANIGRGVKTVAIKSVAEYLVGDDTHGLKAYPPYLYVPYSQIGGFVSDKQRRYVMARIREGTIKPGFPASTGYFADKWTYSAKGSYFEIKNPTPYGEYLVGDFKQSLHSKKQGWRTITKNIQDNLQGAFRHAAAEVKKWLAAQRRHK